MTSRRDPLPYASGAMAIDTFSYVVDSVASGPLGSVGLRLRGLEIRILFIEFLARRSNFFTSIGLGSFALLAFRRCSRPSTRRSTRYARDARFHVAGCVYYDIVLSCNLTLVATVVLGGSIGFFCVHYYSVGTFFSFRDLISCDVTPTTVLIYLTWTFFSV